MTEGALARSTLVVALSIVGSAMGCVCSKSTPSDDGGSITSASSPTENPSFTRPIAAANVGGGAVIVAGLDVGAKALRVKKLGEHDELLGEKTLLDGLAASAEAELKLVGAGGGAAITWRGQRNGKLERLLVVTRPDLSPMGEPTVVAASTCATKDALYWTDGKTVSSRAWAGTTPKVSDLPKDKEAGLVCAAHRAFAVLEEEESTSLLPLSPAEAGAPPTMTLLRDRDFGDDDQRERAEYTVGDDFGVVRLGNAGSFAIRELRAGTLQPMRRLRTTIPHDDDVVAVDASTNALVIVYTHEESDACGTSTTVATKVRAVRVDRTSWEESTIDLAPGACGKEIGPFFTSARPDGVMIAWVERTSAVGKPRSPISGLAHVLVPAKGTGSPLARIDEPADEMVDAGCDEKSCYAVALVAGGVKVLRYR